MQNDNGPCPVIALANCLLLLGHLQIPPSTERISFNELVEMIGNYLLTIEGNEEHHQNLGDALALLPTLDKGLDVNIHFTRADAFEFTAAISMFDCCKILIFHGWVIPPDDSQNYELIAKKLKSYNGLADCIIRGEALNTHDEVYDELMCQVAVCKEFISEHSTQLTFAGLDSLKQLLPEDRPSVLFRNNHFLTILKRDGKLYTMVTDQGYTSSPIVWESLDSITGSSTHYDTNFQHLDPELPTYRQSLSDIKVPATFQETGSSNNHLDPDLMLALELQDEENKRHEEQVRRANANIHLVSTSQAASSSRNNRYVPSTNTSSSSLNSKKSRTKDECVIL